MKIKPNIALLTGISLLIIVSLFYWFQWRPAQIKHDCSWVKKHTDAIQEKSGMTKEQLSEQGIIKNCPPTPTPTHGGVIQSLSSLFADPGYQCNLKNEEIISKNKPQKYVPAKDWYEKANSAEYTFCLHNNGL